ncbi:hypothetical protein DMA12_24860 [Amycolatopsis balhimycina DSM 5908]|uniref:Uncharacterized protein n=1 Tax=Amycolatopsis balhimycina DSM 5908 TaxID=1081091 RepID=A0A428WDR9_AMYBA|nr:hypothetical protein [Amycolatopsis balhimycina]RSM41234.1 hypothetical protein DMA12_24860 [Amycolatopsis balhimycina DSM 5908]
MAGSPDRPARKKIPVLEPGPDRFVAKANVAQHIGCGSETGVTLLVTPVQPARTARSPAGFR